MERINDKLLNWASILEDNTRQQAILSSSMPFIFPHIALMPDAHLGLGATVGSVIPTRGAIIPAAVGVDIGCGMQAVRTQFDVADIGQGKDKLWSVCSQLPEPQTPPALRELHREISSRIPLSVGGSNSRLMETTYDRIRELEAMPGIEQADVVHSHWRTQLGSLGSGNHFIEISLDEQDQVWAFLHSGSRGVGNKLAQKHIRIARELCTEQLPDRDLAYLTEGTAEFAAYIEALMWAQRFAALNRDEMMDRVLDALEHWLGVAVEAQEVIACHHNYTELSWWDDEPIWLSRKGAINAQVETAGLIPGSMGAASYIVEGLGNQDALWSAPHGAGRNHSRSAAKKLFTRQDLDTRMAGITWGESDAFLDEHPDAYKDIDVVMADAADLVSVRHTLRQIVNVKGD